MKCILAVWVLFVTLGILSDVINGRTIKGAKKYSDVSKPVEVSVSCECGGMKAEFRVPVERPLKDVLEAIKGEAAIKRCPKCTVTVFNCDSSYNSLNSCEKKEIAEILKDIPSEVHINIKKEYLGEIAEYLKDIPSEVHIDIKKEYLVLTNRSRREVEGGYGGCNFPRNLKTSHLSCTEHPNKIKCTQKCIFGHTLDEGISRDMKCEFSENAWKPVGFQECNPFVDCSMTLVATGNKSCLVGTPYDPSVCNVTCGDYEDKVATPLTNFECQLNGGWDKPLPHCVISGSGFALVPPPHVKSHSLHDKDEHKKVAKPQKGDKPQKMEKPQKMDKPQEMDKPQKMDKPPKADKPLKHAKPQGPESKAPPQHAH